MREIKFRAWDKSRNIMMSTMDEGSFEDYNRNKDVWDELWGNVYELALSGIEELAQDDSVILMQYTGLKDKNGKEIYEGDIIEGMHDYGPAGMVKRRGIIEWKGDGYLIHFWEDFEVIGNIYENSELIDKK